MVVYKQNNIFSMYLAIFFKYVLQKVVERTMQQYHLIGTLSGMMTN